MRTNILKTSMELIQSPQKNFLRNKYPDWFKITCRALHRLVKSVKEKSIRDIGAHQDLQKPNLAIPKLLIKELRFVQPDNSSC